MIRFVNLDDGSTYDGTQPFVHRPFGSGGLSVDMQVPGRMCFLADKASVAVSLEENPVYELLDQSKFEGAAEEDVAGFLYKPIESLKAEGGSLTLQGTASGEDGIWIYIVYLLGHSEEAGEWITAIDIDGTRYTISGDWYEDDERLWINAANMGFEVPDQIQKTFYQTNVHEDLKDSVVLNRKYKELISNYWGVLAGRGSYKSLEDSLQWFEWGGRTRLEELWKRMDLGRKDYWSRDLSSLLSEEFRESLFSNAKTTYIGLYCAKQKIKDMEGEDHASIYDEEKNPILEWISHKWSWEDLSLKMTLLGNFFETYFMPIHLDLRHSVLEDAVFTNTIKSIHGSVLEQYIRGGYPEGLKCSVKDGQCWVLGDVECQAGPRTLFATRWQRGQQWGQTGRLVGVDRLAEGSVSGTGDAQTFWMSKMGGPGAIADFTVEAPLNEGDSIVKETLRVTYEDGSEEVRTSTLALGGTISFSLLFTTPGPKTLTILLESAAGREFTRTVTIEIVDALSTRIGVYRIGDRDWNLTNWLSRHVPDQTFSRTHVPLDETWAPVYQWIPKGSVGLNHTYVIETELDRGSIPGSVLNQDEWYIGQKDVTGEDGRAKKYLIFISKKYGEGNDLPQAVISMLAGRTIRDDMGYYPQFHTMTPLGGDDLSGYTIDDSSALSFVPEILWGREIEDCEWIFRNVTRDPHGPGIHMGSLRETISGSGSEAARLESGYYDIEFRFRLAGEGSTHTVKLASAFRKI